MIEAKMLLQVLEQKFDHSISINEENEAFPPIFSFEGLPGAGKTTQIMKASRDLEQHYGKSYYIDLPTDSHIGQILKALYKDIDSWEEIRHATPWLNPLLLSIDLKLALQKAKQEEAKFVLMSRGILSTYYYNLDTYISKYITLEQAWEGLTVDLRSFQRPKALIYFDIPADVAYERVVKRNRGPLRQMDQIEQMKSDHLLLQRYLDLFKDDFPIHFIDGSADQDSVTKSIETILSLYLEKK